MLAAHCGLDAEIVPFASFVSPSVIESPRSNPMVAPASERAIAVRHSEFGLFWMIRVWYY